MSISAGSARRRVAADNFGGQCPLTMRTGSFANRNCPSNARYRYCGGSGYAPQSPPCQRGVVLPLPKPGGFHRLAGFHIGPFSLEVPAVNPSVTPAACQLPLTREPCGQCPRTMRTGLVCIRYFPDPPGIVTAVAVGVHLKAPLAKGGCLGTAEAGG